MADFDVYNDKLPKLVHNADHKPTIAQLKAAIAGSGVAASYPTATLNRMTEIDLIYACRTHNITVNTTL